MKTIKFRGIPVASDEFVYGGYVYDPEEDEHLIITFKEDSGDPVLNLVRAETVGQFIGFNDKSDTDIFSGDILQWKVRGSNFERTEREEVVWKQSIEKQSGMDGYGTHIKSGFNMLLCFCSKNEMEVAGNIHQNPELLKS